MDDDPLAGFPDAAHHPDLAGLMGEGLTGRLERWAADTRIDEAVKRRTRARWLERQAREEATIVGVLADLAERRAIVSLRLRSGPPQRGRVGLIGADFVALAPVGGATGRTGEVLVALREVASIATSPGEVESVGDLSSRSRMSLGEVIIELAGDRERVLVVLAGSGEVVRGTLSSVGQDLVVVRVEGEPVPGNVYVALDAVAQLSID